MYACPSLTLVPSTSPDSSKDHLLVLLHSGSSKKGAASALTKKVPTHLAKHPALQGERGAKLAIHGDRTVLFMGVGELASFTAQEASEWGENAGHSLLKEQITTVQVVLPEEMSAEDVVFNFVKGLFLANFRIEDFKTQKKKDAPELDEILLSGKPAALLKTEDVEELYAVVEGIAFAREIVELPSENADPQGIVERFKKAIDPKRIELEVWDEKKIAAKKMGLIQAVSRGSSTPPRFLIARHGKKTGKTLVLVGKGVTFDTGGVNLKTVPYKDLIGMKKDMGGAGAVLGAMLAISKLRPNLNVVAVTPLTTNSLSSMAVHPGDIFTSFSGKTVEIQNTDAEGRLILADALHYATTLNPDWIVDAATLTGACCVALGSYHSGLFSNDRALGDKVLKASEAAGEPAWPMPMSPRYGAELKSQLADLSNMGKGRDGGAQLGAKFMENFVGKTPWVHLDIAGTVDLGEPAAAGAQVHAAGRMVHTFVKLAGELSS